MWNHLLVKGVEKAKMPNTCTHKFLKEKGYMIYKLKYLILILYMLFEIEKQWSEKLYLRISIRLMQVNLNEKFANRKSNSSYTDSNNSVVDI